MSNLASKAPYSANNKSKFLSYFKILTGIALIVLFTMGINFIDQLIGKVEILKSDFAQHQAASSKRQQGYSERIFELEELTHRQSLQIEQLQEALIVLADDDDEERKIDEEQKESLRSDKNRSYRYVDDESHNLKAKERRAEEIARQAQKTQIKIKSAGKYLQNLKKLDSRTKIDEMVDSVRREFQEMRKSLKRSGKNGNVKNVGSYDNETLLKLEEELEHQKNALKELKESQRDQEELGKVMSRKLEEAIKSIRELQLKNNDYREETTHYEKTESKENDIDIGNVLSTVFSAVEVLQDPKLDMKTFGKLKGLFDNIFSGNDEGKKDSIWNF